MARAPENTLASFRLAIENGFQQIELDVRLSKDGVPVVLHDSKVDRTTNGSGEVSGLGLKEIKQLDAGSWFSRDFKNERIPTLREVLKAIGKNSHLHIELKSDEPDLADKVAAELHAAQLPNIKKDAFTVPGLTITSSNVVQLERSLKVLPDVVHGWLIDSISLKYTNRAAELGIDQLCPRASHISKVDVEETIREGFSVRCWGVKTEADLVNAFKAGAQGATVNWPERAERTMLREVY